KSGRPEVKGDGQATQGSRRRRRGRTPHSDNRRASGTTQPQRRCGVPAPGTASRATFARLRHDHGRPRGAERPRGRQMRENWRVPPRLDEIRAVPEGLPHDHLDGGRRAATVVDLARSKGYDRLPSDDVEEVAVWLQQGANRGHLNLYLDAFQHTLAVMQTRDALIRVAAECAEDLDADGVVYAEVRFAPELHVAGGLSLDEVVEAVLEGVRLGSPGRGITIYAPRPPMPDAARSPGVPGIAVPPPEPGGGGVDIAGAEAGWPPSRHLDAFQYVARENFHFTIHAGEGFGLPSIWEALQWCGAERLGHGVRIVDDIRVTPEGAVELGRLASY